MTDWTTHQYIDELWTAIGIAQRKSAHPLRTPTVITTQHGNPRARTMVLREVFDNRYLVFFTDIRSDKCQQLQQHPNIQIHSYCSIDQTQLQFSGTACVLQTHPKFTEWLNRGMHCPTDYSTIESPGSPLNEYRPLQLNTTLAQQHFAVLLCDISSIEILTLGIPHRRCRWSYRDDSWRKDWLVP